MPDLLESVIDQLDFNSGQLYDSSANVKSLYQYDLLDKGDWLAASRKAGAEKIFFVDNNPVVVFARCTQDIQAKIETFNRLWCLSRPRILFLEAQGELSVIDLAQAPIRSANGKVKPQLKTLEMLNSVQAITRQLQEFHRDNIESGKVFEKGRFGSIKHRADQTLIADLKTVRQELMAKNLSSSNSHALIGRSIFIRYLEDRGILTEAYFLKVAELNSKWRTLLHTPLSRENLDFSGIRAFFPRVLQNKSFTYALFRTLAADFNGDMFPNIDDEESHVQDQHMQLIQDLLYGDAGAEKKLFFFSYRFDIIPLDLISAIYEEFYHSSSGKEDKISKARQDGAYYTPPALAEFVLSRLLTVDVLKQNPRILDPACGSGIFLVEAFRRIIRYHICQRSSVPSFNELKQILGKQIVGIEVNEEAARITAFSLYLAMLHYLEPPSILEYVANGNKLPNLIASGTQSANHYNNLHIGNAFAIDNKAVGDVDVIVGNPPWGAPDHKADQETKKRQIIMMQWCRDRNHPIGDNEQSQAFLWRVTDFLKPNGQCALLTSAGVLFKHSSTTQDFRKKWMSLVCITEVFNFTHVRKYFFKAVSPFLMIHFKKTAQKETPVDYWSPKQVSALKETQAVLLSKYDRAYLVGEDLTDNTTWKVNWFGRHADARFVSHVNQLSKLIELVDRTKSGQGYKRSPAELRFPGVRRLPSLEPKCFDRYSELSFKDSPEKYHRAGILSVYHGVRLLVKRGISESGATKGTIISRFETNDFCFSNAINGLKFIDDNEITYLIVLGLLWSSFSRYFFFNISANWGLWHHEIHLDDELLQFPIPKYLSGENAKRVLFRVKKLRDYRPQVSDLIHNNGVPQQNIDAQRTKLEAELDEAVFDLYGFTEDQRDLIRDCCEVTLPFFYQPYTSLGANPAIVENDFACMQNYAERFVQRWKPYLTGNEVLRADLHIGASGNMIAMEFYPADLGDKWDLNPQQDTWSHILDEIGKNLPQPMGTSQILLDGIVFVVSDNSIIVIKRNQKRFWTRSLAWEDAESTLAKRMLDTIPESRGL